MDKKRILASVIVFLILALLVYLQYRHWRTFDWGTFWSQTHRIRKFQVLYAIVLIYAAYTLRAVRWKIFLKPVRPSTTVAEMVSPTLVGFAGLALLGRAGEFIRPYLIARRTNLSFSSQLAVWAVERIFDCPGDLSAQRAAVHSSSRVLRAFSRRGLLPDRPGSGYHGGGGADRPQHRRRSAVCGTTFLASLLELRT
jgi:hypothetical protein